jgi:TetR/AcrR family transcriptional repressor of mexJK operon
MSASSRSRSAARAPPKPRGRPKDASKRRAILDAAKELFADAGFSDTSMDAIAARAGVSKLTLYSHFGGKDELFAEAVRQKCSEYAPPELFDPRTRLALRARLLDIGWRFLQLVAADESMNLYRMMAEDARRAGHLGKLFFSVGPQQTIDRFARLLEAAHASGELRVPDPAHAACHFFCLLKGVHHLRALVGARPMPPPAQQRRHVEEVVDLFLRAFAPR